MTAMDEAAFERPASTATEMDRAVAALWPTAYRIARLILRDDGAAEDAAQESCIRALQRGSQVRNPDAFAPWFRQVVSNVALSARRQIERRRRREEPAAPQPEPASAFDPSAGLDLASAMEHMTDELRVPLVLVYYSGFTSVEVARRMNIAPATVRYRLAEARRILRPLLETQA